jgi:putative aminopeptidase FrvX
MIRDVLTELMLIPGLAGYEDRVARAIAAHLDGWASPTVPTGWAT